MRAARCKVAPPIWLLLFYFEVAVKGAWRGAWRGTWRGAAGRAGRCVLCERGAAGLPPLPRGRRRCPTMWAKVHRCLSLSTLRRTARAPSRPRPQPCYVQVALLYIIVFWGCVASLGRLASARTCAHPIPQTLGHSLSALLRRPVQAGSGRRSHTHASTRSHTRAHTYTYTHMQPHTHAMHACLWSVAVLKQRSRIKQERSLLPSRGNGEGGTPVAALQKQKHK